METLNKEAKKQALKDIILQLHKGLPAEKARDRFEKEIGNVNSTEIAEMEQSLIDEGLSADEIKKFCNVHALIFQSSLEKAVVEETSPSHPVYLFKQENREIEKLARQIKEVADSGKDLKGVLRGINVGLRQLKEVEKHYERKAQVLFPYLEKHGFMGPSKVMWGKDNEIKGMLKAALTKIDPVDTDAKFSEYKREVLLPLLEEVTGMIFKEENILYPSALEKLTREEWAEILRESEDIGYAFISPPAEASVLIKHLTEAVSECAAVRDDTIEMNTGSIKLEELMPLLNTLPVDVTFVDKDDKVAYFSQGKDRIFSRTRSVIGRKVQNCHPPQSLPVVEKILNSFKDGTKDSYEFWINLQGKLVYIRYFAVRDESRRYLGTMEITQDITGIKKLEGERRLIDENNQS
jgi:uncharacterized protein